jgi:hypothetical protein
VGVENKVAWLDYLPLIPAGFSRTRPAALAIRPTDASVLRSRLHGTTDTKEKGMRLKEKIVVPVVR